MLIVFSQSSPSMHAFPALYTAPIDSDEVTTLEGRPLYDQAQPGGADWRSILKDIQAQRKQLQDKNAGKLTKDEESKSEEESETEEKRGDSETLDSQVSKRASVALLSKLKSNNRQQRSRSKSESQRFGRFNKQVPASRSYFHEYPDNNRFEGDEPWRSPTVFSGSPVVLRPVLDENTVLAAAASAVAAAENSGNGADAAGYLSALDRLKSSQQSNQNRQAGKDGNIQQILNSQVSRSQQLQQYLSNDFGEGTDRIFLLVKTGYSVQWDRLPTHFFSTFTRFPNFAIYSDAASSMGGYEIIDILQDLPMSVLHDPQLGLYIEQQKARQDHTYTRPPPAKDERPWIMDKFKNIPMLQHAWKHAPDLDWYVIMDDDSYFLSDNLGRWLNTLDPNKPYYLGSAVAGLQHVFAHGGSGIVLSRGLMEMAFGHIHSDEWVDEYATRALRECCGDFLLAAFLKEKLDVGLNLSVSGKRFQGEGFVQASFNRRNWCSDIVSFHRMLPSNTELLWEYERVRSNTQSSRGRVFSPDDSALAPKAISSITYGDIYTDFVKPYLLPMRATWDNGARDHEYSWVRDAAAGTATVEDYLRNDGYSDKPYTSVDKCRQACLARADCLMFRYDPYQKYCGFSSSVSFGQPKTSYRDGEVRQLLKQHGVIQPARTRDETMHSEWRLDRIRDMRKKLTCDPSPEIDAAEDGDEGWYWRAKESSHSLIDEVNKNKK